MINVNTESNLGDEVRAAELSISKTDGVNELPKNEDAILDSIRIINFQSNIVKYWVVNKGIENRAFIVLNLKESFRLK